MGARVRFGPSCFVVMALAMKAARRPAMKAAMKGMKAMKKVKKVSIIARGKLAKVAVFKGKKLKTVGGLTKETLTKSKSGKIVSKAASARARKNWAQSVSVMISLHCVRLHSFRRRNHT